MSKISGAIRVRLLTMLLICTILGGMSVSASTLRGKYPTRKGTILVTSDYIYGLLPTGHAAIVWDANHVIEAQGKGIVIGKNNWMQTRREVFGVTVRQTSKEQDAKAAAWCKKQLGKKYNINYFNKKTRKKFYCSQLVWAAFYDLYHIDLSDEGWRPATWTSAVHPLELVTSRQTKTIFYYKR